MTRQEIEFSLQEIYIGLLGRAADAWIIGLTRLKVA